ncbi:MAG: thioredoxin [Peptococcaceae bacterium]|nr:thioredoxin [Peptococcaceae bacterium]
MAKIITKDNFQQEVLNAEQPVLIDFWAPWCGPCKMFSPILEDLSREIGDAALIGKVNIDEQEELAAAFSVFSIPTVVVLKDGKEINRSVGVKDKESLKRMLAI